MFINAFIINKKITYCLYLINKDKCPFRTRQEYEIANMTCSEITRMGMLDCYDDKFDDIVMFLWEMLV
jgi:hypothetical protein